MSHIVPSYDYNNPWYVCKKNIVFLFSIHIRSMLFSFHINIKSMIFYYIYNLFKNTFSYHIINLILLIIQYVFQHLSDSHIIK